MVGPGWFSCCVGDANKSLTKQFVMPSHTAGQADARLPRRLRPRRAGRRQQGARRRLDQGLHEHVVDDRSARDRQHPEHDEPARLEREREGGAQSWFVPTAKNWVNVENGNILRNMLAQILTGKLTIKQAAQSAERQHRVGPERIGRRRGRTRISVDEQPGPRAHRRRRGRVRAASAAASRPGSARSGHAARTCCPPRPRRDRGDPGLPALPARRPLVPAVRAARADPAQGHLGRARELQRPSSTTRSSGTRSSARSCSRPPTSGSRSGSGRCSRSCSSRSAPIVRVCSPRASCSSGRCPSSSPSRSGTG